MSKQPIGVFDSGIGGLSVIKQIMVTLPHENIIYFGDLARIPYGTKSVDMVRKYAEQSVKFLLKQNVKFIVIACNTISAVALDTVKKIANNIPVIDVISSCVNKIESKNNIIGLIATPVTIASHAYENLIKIKYPNTKIINQPTPLLVPLIEDGLQHYEATKLICKAYLKPLIQENINTLILGCTHYPIIYELFQELLQPSIEIIDPAIETSIILKNQLLEKHLLNMANKTPDYKYFVTDIPTIFKQLGEMFLNHAMPQIDLIDLEKHI